LKVKKVVGLRNICVYDVVPAKLKFFLPAPTSWHIHGVVHS
jgi:hypothetical protein